MKLNDLRIVVTGAAGGLGRQFCRSLIADGAHVAAFDVDAQGLHDLALGLPADRLFTFVADVSREAEVVHAVGSATAVLGSINALINNAGIYRDGLIARDLEGAVLKMPLAQWRSVLDVDLTGPFLVTREVAAQMIEKHVRPGIIVNISSIMRHGNAGQSCYSAAKAGVVSASRLWADELARYGIRVCSIAPGFVRTPILEATDEAVLAGWIERTPLQRLGEPSEIYAGVRFAIECDFFNGRCLEIDGGLRV